MIFPYGGDEMLFEILHFDWFRIAPIEIAKLSAAVADKHFADKGVSLRKALYEKVHAPATELFSQGPPAGMREACLAIEALIADVSNVTLVNLFENCLRKAYVLNWVMQDPDKHTHLQVLTSLFDFAKEEARRNPSLTWNNW
jgi:DNA helicase-2/ATP-dependent DNA helicase PcrA